MCAGAVPGGHSTGDARSARGGHSTCAENHSTLLAGRRRVPTPSGREKDDCGIRRRPFRVQKTAGQRLAGGLVQSVRGCGCGSVAFRPAVALLHARCSGPVYLRRSVSSCPRSHGSPAVMGWPHRAQGTVPVATRGAHAARMRWCAHPYPRAVVLPILGGQREQFGGDVGAHLGPVLGVDG